MRLFVGLSLPEDATAALARLSTGLEDARWVRPENLHMTLRFIGEVGSNDADDIDTVFSEIHAPGFELSLDGLGHFGRGRKVRAVWAGVTASEALTHLQAKVESAVVRAGYPPEGRKFRPHVTLARFRGGRKPKNLESYLESNGAFTFPPFNVEAFTLFESRMGHGGSHYVALSTYDLGRAAG